MATKGSDNYEQTRCDRLALARTLLANERTLLAYVRTAIMFAATGATLLKFYSDQPTVVALGWLLIAIGISAGAFGARRCQKLARTLN